METALPLANRSATELAASIRRGETTATDVVEAHLDRIEAVDETIHAFVTITADAAREAAADADRAVAENDDLGPLHGVPVALKDLGSTKAGVRNTCGTALFADNVADRTSAIVERLEAAGAIVIGTTNAPAFGHKGTTTNELIGPTASPVDPALNAGGSSGGSAAAVGAGMVPIATGSDAGGSLRIPAAGCGVYTIKPTMGVVPDDKRPSTFGRSIHHSTKGPLARTVADAAAMLDVMAGPHPADPHSAPIETEYAKALDDSIEEWQIAYSPDLDVFPVEERVRSVVEDALSAFEAAGATVETVRLGHGYTMDELADAVVPTFTTALSDMNSRLRERQGIDLRDHADEVAESLLAMIDAGETFDTADVARTGIARTAMFDAVQDVLVGSAYDLLVTPTCARTGIALDGELAFDEWDFPLTWPFNWTDHPAASIPAGTTDEGYPVGLQLVGRRFDEARVLAASAAFERQRPWPTPYEGV
ncbi:amidase [Halovivax gelatinilyticus]|uniref:amidase n=1 Tax=Halovivax gelatinilyticus TaxID=2961597 RepID=UPI0020CA50AF|nr:amidase [Halovivax gelatinilyticus]